MGRQGGTDIVFGDVWNVLAPLQRLLDQGVHRIGDVGPPPIVEGHLKQKALVVGSLLLGAVDDGGERPCDQIGAG